MPEVHASESPVDENINDLYWNSDRTVDEIVDELGIGRNTLYSAVRPQPTGASCPDCGERLMYTNRTHRTSGTATCSQCGRETDVSEWGQAGEAAGADPAAHGFDGAEGDRGWSRWRHDLAAVAPERAAMIGGAAALGVVLGAAAARAVREMR